MTEHTSALSNTLPSLGVGITYFSELDPLIFSGLVDYIEIEPQALWMKHNGNYKMPDEIKRHLNNFNLNNLVHSIGLPVGGTFRGDIKQIDLLVQNINDFNVPWASEHLAFNSTAEFQTGFFLPPAQTIKGIQVAVEGIKYLQNKLPVPFAVETGVNYLRPVKSQMPDGEFITQVITQADCGLLLDIHNLYANQLNGRQTIREFIKQIPLERVWEVHLAGGFEMDGFYLDAHSGNMSEELTAIAKEVVSQLPNLKAITYELLSSYIPVIGLSKIESEIEIVRQVWDLRPRCSDNYFQVKRKMHIYLTYPDQSLSDWEESLGALAIGNISNSAIAGDPAIPLLRKLIHEFRGSMLVNIFRLTTRFLMLTLTVDVFKTIANDFWQQYPPRQFASEEALNFSEYLKRLDLKVPNLYKVLEFEESTLLTLLDNKTRVVAFSHDPFPLLKALADGMQLNVERHEGNFEIEITGELE